MPLYYINQDQLSYIASAMESKIGQSLSLSYPKGFINTIKSMNKDDYDSDMTRWFFENRDTMSSFHSDYISEIKSIYFVQFANCENLEVAAFPECSIINRHGFIGCSKLLSASFPICKEIGESAFYGCRSLSSITIPECETLSDNAFRSCYNLKQINLPKCPFVPSSAFAYCSSLSSANIPLCMEVASYGFQRCGVKTIQLPICQTLGFGAFQQCTSLTEVSLPNCTNIGHAAFNGCTDLSRIDLPMLSSIGDNVFQNCSSLSIISIGRLTSVNVYKLDRILVKEMYLPSLIYAYSSAFYSCANLEYISLPACSYLYSRCFASCPKLSMLDLPKCRNFYGFSLFDGCSKLEAIFLTSTSYATLAYANTFYNCPISKSTYLGRYGSIFVPSSMLASYKKRTNWSYYSNRFVGIGSIFWFHIMSGISANVYAAESGATWGQWVSSPLNIGKAYSITSTGGICLNSTGDLVLDMSTFTGISTSDLILSDATYIAMNAMII